MPDFGNGIADGVGRRLVKSSRYAFHIIPYAHSILSFVRRLSALDHDQADQYCEMPEKTPVAHVETSSACNYECSHCFIRQVNPRETIGHMDMELFRSAVDQLVSLGVRNLGLHNRGEPLLNRFIVDMVGYAKHKGIRLVHLLSNGYLLTEDVGRRLMKAGLDHMRVSVDGVGTEYDKIRRQGSFDTVLSNLKTFIEIRRKLGISCKVSVTTHLSKQTVGTIDDWCSIFFPIADYVDIRLLYNMDGGVAVSKYYQENKVFSLPLTKLPCLAAFDDPVVRSDGRVVFCCRDSSSRFSLGDLGKGDRLSDIWSGAEMREIRRAHLTGTRRDLPSMCRTCLSEYGLVGRMYPKPRPVIPIYRRNFRHCLSA